MKLLGLMLVALTAMAQVRVVALPSRSPLVTFRIVFLTGAASDPSGKPGVANMTASMLADGGTKALAYKQIVDAMFPMAASVASQVDKEMTTFSAVTHVDNLDGFYRLFRSMLLEPGWRDDDFRRLKDQSINFLRVSLRGNNDEELGKEVLYSTIYQGHPYEHENTGTISSIEKMSLADLQSFYRSEYTQANLVVGIAGGYPPEFLDRVKKDFGNLPAGKRSRPQLPQPKPIDGLKVLMVEKNTRSVAISFGFPIEVKRGHPDFPALLLAQSYFGQHRSSGGHLYQQIRESRGLNYGDYAYIEYFPRGMFLFEPQPNLARQQQIFQIWIRPVDPATAHFTLRLAFSELERLLKDGIPNEAFEKSRSFLSKYVNLLMKTKGAELGYAIDSQYYGIPEYSQYLKGALAKLTREDVNRAIRKHLRAGNLQIVIIGKDCERLKDKLVSNAASPMKYNSPKPREILEQDQTLLSWKLDIKPDAVKIVPVEKIFE